MSIPIYCQNTCEYWAGEYTLYYLQIERTNIPKEKVWKRWKSWNSFLSFGKKIWGKIWKIRHGNTRFIVWNTFVQSLCKVLIFLLSGTRWRWWKETIPNRSRSNWKHETKLSSLEKIRINSRIYVIYQSIELCILVHTNLVWIFLYM